MVKFIIGIVSSQFRQLVAIGFTVMNEGHVSYAIDRGIRNTSHPFRNIFRPGFRSTTPWFASTNSRGSMIMVNSSVKFDTKINILDRTIRTLKHATYPTLDMTTKIISTTPSLC